MCVCVCVCVCNRRGSVAMIRSICPASPFLSHPLSVAPPFFNSLPASALSSLPFTPPHRRRILLCSLEHLAFPASYYEAEQRALPPWDGHKGARMPSFPLRCPLEQGAETMEAHVRSLIISVEVDYIEGGVP